MHSENNRFDKALLMPYFEQWEQLRVEIDEFYNRKDPQVVKLMNDAIANFCELLELGGKEIDNRTGKAAYVFLPLNGEERFEFVKNKVSSRYAFVQLDALMLEMKKKIARLAIQRK